MRRTDIRELHYITSIENVPSILERGILCHNAATKVPHSSIANKRVQQRRAAKTVPLRGGGRKPLHAYANLYFNAHNWMLKEVLGPDGDAPVCVLRINPSVLEISGAVVSTCNAAKSKAKFYKNVDVGLAQLDKAQVFARYPTEQSQAEALIPDSVGSDLIVGVAVGSGSHLSPPMFGHYDSVRSYVEDVRGLHDVFVVTISRPLFHQW